MSLEMFTTSDIATAIYIIENKATILNRI